MGALRKSLWTIAAITALPAPAAAQNAPDICGALGQIIAAAHESPPFASVERRLRAGESVIPDYAAGACQASAGEGLSCHGMNGRNIMATWPDLATCPGVVAVVEAPPVHPRAPPLGNGWARLYRAGDLRIEHSVHCLLCAGPAFSHFTVRFEPARRPGGLSGRTAIVTGGKPG